MAVTKREERLKKAFLEEIRKVPNFRIACERLSIPTPILYTWKREDADFWEQALTNLEIGKEWTNFFAEQKLLQLVEKGNIHAIKHWLEANDSRYRRKKPVDETHQCKMPQTLTDLFRLAAEDGVS